MSKQYTFKSVLKLNADNLSSLELLKTFFNAGCYVFSGYIIDNNADQITKYTSSLVDCWNDLVCFLVDPKNNDNSIIDIEFFVSLSNVTYCYVTYADNSIAFYIVRKLTRKGLDLKNGAIKNGTCYNLANFPFSKNFNFAKAISNARIDAAYNVCAAKAN